MKLNFKISTLLLASTVLLWSCEKEETKAVLAPGGATSLSATSTTLVLTQANAANNAVSFTWGKATFGFDAAVNYTLQFAKAGTNFANPATTTVVDMGTATTKSF